MLRFAFAVVVFVALMLTSVPSTHAASLASPDATRIIELINDHRAAAGLRPVTLNVILMTEAQRFSGVQAELGTLSHRGTDNTTGGQRLTAAGYRWSFWGENLAAGQETAEQVVAAWMASAGHRANVLSPLAREIGIGHTLKADDAAGYYDYWVMEVGKSR
jgi:uncharacterized protein YkwD